jgi:hypothetical protein
VIVDSSVAHVLNSLMQKSSKNDNFMVLCNVSQMAYGYGIPERIEMLRKGSRAEMITVYPKEVYRAAPEKGGSVKPDLKTIVT